MRNRLTLLLALIYVAASNCCWAQSDYRDYENEGLAWMRGTGGGPINRIIAHPDGRHLIMAQDNIQVFDVETGDVVKMLYGPGNVLDRCDLTPDGRMLATSGGYDVLLWDTDTWD